MHGGFIAINALIPNPIKSSIRKAIRDHIRGKDSATATSVANAGPSIKAVDPAPTTKKIVGMEKEIRDMSKYFLNFLITIKVSLRN